MTKRQKHSGSGHKLTPFPAKHKREGFEFYQCLCGWLGWLPIERSEKMSETSLKTKVNAELARLREVKRRIKTLGDDVYDDGDVIAFKKHFQNNANSYHYAALKIGNKWYVSGGRLAPMTWDDLVEFIVLNNYIEPFEIKRVSKWAVVN